MIITTKKSDGTYSYESINLSLEHANDSEKKYTEIKTTNSAKEPNISGRFKIWIFRDKKILQYKYI